MPPQNNLGVVGNINRMYRDTHSYRCKSEGCTGTHTLGEASSVGCTGHTLLQVQVASVLADGEMSENNGQNSGEFSRR